LAWSCGDGQRKELRQLSDAVTVEPGSLDFGDVALGREQTTQLKLRNDGIVATTVDMVPGSATVPDFQVSGLPAKLRPGESIEIEAVFKPAALGVRNRTLDLTTPFAGANPTVGLRGNAVRGLATISDASIDFGNVVMGEKASATLSLTNNDGKAQTDVTIDGTTGADAASFHYSPDGKIDLAPDQSLTVQIDLLPTRLGAFDAALVIVPSRTCQPRQTDHKGLGGQQAHVLFNASDGAPATLDASGSGYGPVLSAKPVPFDVGPTAIGTTRTKKLVLTNVGLDPTQADPLIITGITLQASNPQA